ncbi:MAG TPA: hypothetical protein VGS19_04920 [Streptosporangiaceae bacterium]|nr:hypothetical protein [Streptosporangiaceae bacterium]
MPVAALLAGGLVAATSAGGAHGRPRWDVAADFRIAPDQANPSPDRMGHPAVWSYLFSSTGQRNPADYKLLPGFDTDKFQIHGLESWWGTNISNVDDLLPSVGINATGHEVSPFNVYWPAGTVLVHPWSGQPVVIGWRSPVPGNIFVTGAVALAQHPNCGTGIAWSLDLGARSLRHGAIQHRQRATWSLRVHLTRGDSLYLVVAPRIGFACDSTLVDLTITRGNQ